MEERCQSSNTAWLLSCLDRGALITVDTPGCGTSVVRGPTGPDGFSIFYFPNSTADGA